MTIRLKQVKDYLYCPLLYYWKNETVGDKNAPLHTTLELPRLAIQQALQTYTIKKYQNHDLDQLVKLIWKIWLDQNNVGNDIQVALEKYHETRYEKIMVRFLNGDERKTKDRSKYIEPRASSRYKEFIKQYKLDELAEGIDSALPKMKIASVDMNYIKLGKYSLADAYSDSIHMALQFPMPSAQAIVGVDVKTKISIEGEGEIIEARADMIVANKEKSTIYVHDFTPHFVFKRGEITRRLDVIAASSMTPVEGGIEFPPIDKLVFRHFMTGAEITRKQFRPSRLIQSAIMAQRGISAKIFPPAFLSGDVSLCNKCTEQERCLKSEDALEHIFPGAQHMAIIIREIADGMDAAVLKKLGDQITLEDITMAANFQKEETNN